MHITPDLWIYPRSFPAALGEMQVSGLCPSLFPTLLLLGQLFTNGLMLQSLSLLAEDSISFFVCWSLDKLLIPWCHGP